MHDERPAQCPPPVFDPNARKSAFTYSLDLRAGIVALLLLAAGLSFAILVTASNRHRRTGSSLESVSSAALRSVGYDADSRALDVEFHSGDIYRYYDVPPSVYAGLMAADSHGRYFHEHIRGQSYRYVKLWPVSVIPGEHSEPIGEAKRPIDRALDAAEVTQKHQDLVNRIERMRREIEAEKPLLEAARAIQRNQEPPAAVRMADLLGEAVIMSNDGEFLGVISTTRSVPGQS